jgi:hypothetical protein
LHNFSAVQQDRSAGAIIQTTTELKSPAQTSPSPPQRTPNKPKSAPCLKAGWWLSWVSFQIKHGFAFDGQFFEPSGEYILMTPGHFHEEGGLGTAKDKIPPVKFPDYILAKDDLVVAMTEQSGLRQLSLFLKTDATSTTSGSDSSIWMGTAGERFLFTSSTSHPESKSPRQQPARRKYTSPPNCGPLKSIPPTLEEQTRLRRPSR